MCLESNTLGLLSERRDEFLSLMRTLGLVYVKYSLVTISLEMWSLDIGTSKQSILSSIAKQSLRW